MNETIECVNGEKWRYLVGSASNPEGRHLVDLQANDLYGECGCPDFVCRRFPAHRKTGSMKRCRHLELAREKILNFVINNAK